MAAAFNTVSFDEFEPLWQKAIKNAHMREVFQATGIPDSVYYTCKKAGTIKRLYLMALKGYLADSTHEASTVNLLVSINGKGVTSRAVDNDLQQMTLAGKSFIMVPVP